MDTVVLIPLLFIAVLGGLLVLQQKHSLRGGVYNPAPPTKPPSGKAPPPPPSTYTPNLSAMETLIALGKEMNAGAVKSVARRPDGTILRIICVYFETEDPKDLAFFLDDLEYLESEYGMGP